MSDAIHASAAPKAVGRYPHARRVGELLFLSGIGPRSPGTDAIPAAICPAMAEKAAGSISSICRFHGLSYAILELS